MQYTLRKAGLADAAGIAHLSRQTFYETFAADNTAEDMALFLDKQFTVPALIAEVGAAGNTFLLVEEAAESIGYARLREATHALLPKDKTALEIARIYVAKSKIGAGIGKLLMQACIDEAVQANKKIVWLGVWEKNSRAIRFYEQWGFEKFSETTFQLGNDLQTDWLMKKEL